VSAFSGEGERSLAVVRADIDVNVGALQDFGDDEDVVLADGGEEEAFAEVAGEGS
jgi:hypothetical protein